MSTCWSTSRAWLRWGVAMPTVPYRGSIWVPSAKVALAAREMWCWPWSLRSYA